MDFAAHFLKPLNDRIEILGFDETDLKFLQLKIVFKQLVRKTSRPIFHGCTVISRSIQLFLVQL